MKKKDNGEIKIRKPSFFIYTIPAYIVKFIAKIKWRMKTDGSALKGVKGPILAVAAHASTLDIVPVVCTLLPRRFNMVAAKDLFTWKQLKPFINRFGAIPMNQCAMDLASIKMIKAAADRGRNIALFPEGRSSLDGRQSYYLNPSIGKLVKFLECTVAVVETHGVYATKPRYVKGFRKGRIEAKARVLITKEEIKTLKPAEIYERIRDSLVFNDNVWQQENHVEFKAKELASNLNYILYKCPKCGAEYETEASGDKLRCRACGNTVTYTPDGHLVAEGDGASIDRIDLWMDYERESVREEIEKDEEFRIAKPVIMYKRNDEVHKYVKEGEGEFFISKDAIGYLGTRNGAEWRTELPIANMPAIVTKNSEGIDLILDNKTYRFEFVEKKYSTKFGIVVEVMFAKRHGIPLTEKDRMLK